MSALISGRNAPNIILIVFGAAFFLFGTLMLNGYGNKSSCTEPVSAKVVKMEKYTSRDTTGKHRGTSTTYAPVFEYEYGGRQYTFKSSIASNPPEFSVGEQVTVWVDPDSPNKIYYKPSGLSVLMSIVFRIVGGLAAVGGLALLIKDKAKNKIA